MYVNMSICTNLGWNANSQNCINENNLCLNRIFILMMAFPEQLDHKILLIIHFPKYVH